MTDTTPRTACLFCQKLSHWHDPTVFACERCGVEVCCLSTHAGYRDHWLGHVVGLKIESGVSRIASAEHAVRNPAPGAALTKERYEDRPGDWTLSRDGRLWICGPLAKLSFNAFGDEEQRRAKFILQSDLSGGLRPRGDGDPDGSLN